MNSIYIPFLEKSNLLITDVVQRARIIESSIAIAISKNSVFPTAPLEDPANFYITQVLGNVRNCVSGWNENLIFDLKSCVDQVRAFWMIRYAAAFPADFVFNITKDCFFSSLFSVSLHLPAEQQEFMEQYKNEILQLSMDAAFVIKACVNTDNSTPPVNG